MPTCMLQIAHILANLSAFAAGESWDVGCTAQNKQQCKPGILLVIVTC